MLQNLLARKAAVNACDQLNSKAAGFVFLLAAGVGVVVVVEYVTQFYCDLPFLWQQSKLLASKIAAVGMVVVAAAGIAVLIATLTLSPI